MWFPTVIMGSQIHRQMPSGLDRSSWDPRPPLCPLSLLTEQAISPSSHLFTYPVIQIFPRPLRSPVPAICAVAIINMFLSEQSIWMSPSGTGMIKGFENLHGYICHRFSRVTGSVRVVKRKERQKENKNLIHWKTSKMKPSWELAHVCMLWLYADMNMCMFPVQFCLCANICMFFC